MSDDKNSAVDPRFDAAFQRGFDPSVPIEESVPPQQPRKPAAVGSVQAAPAPAPSVALASEKPVSRPTPKAPLLSAPEPELVVVPGAEDADGASVEPDVLADSESNPSRNPFLLFLGIIAVALVAAGIWLFVRSGEAFNSAEVRSQGDYMSLDATIHMAPFIALLGGATAIGILFMFAAKYRRPR